MQNNTVSVIGLGKLGASMVAGFASRGLKVIGVDAVQEVVDKLGAGIAPVNETGLQALIENHSSLISATTSTLDAVMNSEISFVIVPTPSDARGAFSTEYTEKAFIELGKALKEKNEYHVVVLTSTVLPGSTRNILLPILEQYSGKKCGEDFGLCYSPEFIALGSVIRDFLNPDFYLVGEYDQQSGDALELINSVVAIKSAPSKRLSIENAELAKIAINSFVTMKITFANMLSEICEQLPGGNIDEVSDALGMDSRIGRKYLTGGLGYGGPCFPRDNVALALLASELGVDNSVPLSTHKFNLGLASNLSEKVLGLLSPDMTIGVLGLAYKPLSHVVEESAAILLCQELIKKGYQISAHDPLAIEASRTVLGEKITLFENISDCIEKSDLIIIANPDPVYQNLDLSALELTDKPRIVYDCWRTAPNLSNFKNIRYLAAGTSHNDSANTEHIKDLWKVTS